MPLVPVSQLQDYVGKELGRSEWLTIDQNRINQFAECTGDHQFIHVDPVKAKHTPFGGTIAHGFLSLASSIVEMTEKRAGQWLIKAQATLEIEGEEKPAYIAEPLTLCFV